MCLFSGTWKQLHHLDAVGLCESGLGAHVWAQWCDSDALCLRAQKYPFNIHRLETALQQHTSIAPTGVCSAAVLPGHPAELCISFAPPQLTN